MRRWHLSVRNRLTARFCRIFARSIRAEAHSRKSDYQIGPFHRGRKSLEGWFEVADWLDVRAIEYDNRANRAREPRF